MKRNMGTARTYFLSIRKPEQPSYSILKKISPRDKNFIVVNSFSQLLTQALRAPSPQRLV